MRRIFERRRDLIIDLVNQIPGLSVLKPDGAFYAFVNVSKLIGKSGVSSSIDFASYLLEKHHVACVPGAPFGSDDHVRLSFATNEEIISEGMRRIKLACSEL